MSTDLAALPLDGRNAPAESPALGDTFSEGDKIAPNRARFGSGDAKKFDIRISNAHKCMSVCAHACVHAVHEQLYSMFVATEFHGRDKRKLCLKRLFRKEMKYPEKQWATGHSSCLCSAQWWARCAVCSLRWKMNPYFTDSPTPIEEMLRLPPAGSHHLPLPEGRQPHLGSGHRTDRALRNPGSTKHLRLFFKHFHSSKNYKTVFAKSYFS